MEVIKTAIDGVVIIEPRIFADDRGYFFESFSERDFNAQVRTVHFVQDNESRSCYGVLRGLHFQKPPYAQSKLVRVVKGAVLDVAVSGVDICILGYAFRPEGGVWSTGVVLLLSAIVVSLYTLTRNQRTIRFNNRYLYNIVILYLLAQILYKVYINPYLTAI